jgi:uncharacterized protein (TIGR02145 family)
LLSAISYGQVGINNLVPKGTLDVQSKTADGSASEGLIIPRITGNALHMAEAAGVYGADQHAILTYVTVAPDPDNRTGQVEGMDTPGFYYFDSGSNRWVKMISSGTSTASVTQLLCSNSSDVGVLEAGSLASGVSTTIPYTGGNSGTFSGLSVASTGTVTGLTATLASGTLNNGNGTLIFNISGTPSGSGTAVFVIDFAGEICGFNRTVQPSTSFADTVPVIINGQTRQMSTRNLGADPTQDPNVPSQSIMGSYFQWGKKNAVALASTGSGAISGWSTSSATNKAWNSGTEAVPVKTANDPCPTGYRVPTRNEWTAFNSASTNSNIGTWATGQTDGATNYMAAKVFINNGSTITFPSAGSRSSTVGALGYRATSGAYWSSTEFNTNAYDFYFNNSTIIPATDAARSLGISIRCISE